MVTTWLEVQRDACVEFVASPPEGTGALGWPLPDVGSDATSVSLLDDISVRLSACESVRTTLFQPERSEYACAAF